MGKKEPIIDNLKLSFFFVLWNFPSREREREREMKNVYIEIFR